jgi:hypothetical protein
MDDERPGLVTIRFRLEQDQDGWPRDPGSTAAEQR